MNKPVVLITGGASGIGAATVEEFLHEGWRVVIADIDIKSVKAELNENEHVRLAETNVCEQESVEKAVDLAIHEFGHIDALINNAGIQRWSTLEHLDVDVWQNVMNTNFYGSLFCLHAVGQHMLARGSGAIVNVASMLAERGVAKRGPYSAAKSALMAITRTAAIEWGNRGIRVNGVGPGYVATPLMESYFSSGKIDRKEIVATIPMRRMAKPSEIASVIYFLSSPKASYINGQTLFVDGGFLVNSGIDTKTL